MVDIQLGQALRYRVIADYIKKYNPKSILEIGSGSQGIGGCYNDVKFDGLDLTTCDYAGKEKKTNKNMLFIKGSALDIPINDSTYDFVFSTDMIEHIMKGDREKAFKEAIRVCKKGGYVLFMFPCGFFGKVSDYFFFCMWKLISLIKGKNLVPGRLQEHLDLDYPTHKEIDCLLGNIIKTEKIIENSSVHNLFLCVYISLLSLSRLEKSKIRKFNEILYGNFYHSNSKFGVRKLIIVQK